MTSKFKQLLIGLAAGAVLMVGGLNVIGSRSRVNASSVNVTATAQYRHYHIQSANYHRLKLVDQDAPLWRQPENPGVRSAGNVDHLAHTNRLVHLNQQAVYPARHGKVEYYQIGRQGRTYGWLRADDLKQPREYILPYRYVSQFWPSHANDACEAAALMMALSVKGKGFHTPLRRVVERIPRSKSPEHGYTKNPFRLGTGASIYPHALAQVAMRQFHVHAKSITGASKRSLISDVEHGNPVVYEGSYRMRDTSSDHSLVLLGYRRGYFYFADPYSKTYGRVIDGWVSIRRFMKIFTARKRGARAMLLD